VRTLRFGRNRTTRRRSRKWAGRSSRRIQLSISPGIQYQAIGPPGDW